MNIRNFTIRVLFLALGFCPLAMAEEQESWALDKVVNPSDPSLNYKLQGAGLMELDKPYCKECIEYRQSVQKKLEGRYSTFSSGGQDESGKPSPADTQQ